MGPGAPGPDPDPCKCIFFHGEMAENKLGNWVFSSPL